jgi:ribonucleotide reductase alpha subunit
MVEKIKKRNGAIVDFNPEKIAIVVGKAFQAVRGGIEPGRLESITRQVVEDIERLFADEIPSVEQVQDLVERSIMTEGFYDVAKAYIVYRYEHAKIREEEKKTTLEKIERNDLFVTKRSGEKERFSPEKVRATLERAARGYESAVNIDMLVEQCSLDLYEGISTKDIARTLMMTVRAFIEQDPCYSKVAARLLLGILYKEVVGADTIDFNNLDRHYREAFIYNIKKGVEIGRLDPRMLVFDLEALTEALKPERDELLLYLGIQVLYDRYFLRDPAGKQVLETPQAFWMRVAMGLALLEEKKVEHAVMFYELLSSLRFVSSTPTLFHAGLMRPQLSSCFINTVPDDLTGIFKSYADNAQLLKWSGGMGTDWTDIRATGALIKGIGVESQGVIPFLKIANDTTISINRSGRRRGAACVYLEVWHHDIEDFLELRKNTGDERRRTHDMDTAAWIPDLFMKRVRDDGEWTLLSPEETPDLHHLYGKRFEERYAAYEQMARNQELQLTKTVRARDLWKKMLAMLFETGHPWITFKDPSNIRSPQDHVGVVHSSNLCCMAADQRVVTDRGLLTVGSLYRQGGRNKVVGLDGAYSASEMLLPRPNTPMVEIQTKEGYTHKVTPDHKVWVKNQGWTEARYLRKGDKLLTQQLEGLWGQYHNPRLAYLMGLIAGDGTFNRHSVFIDIWKNDFQFIQKTTRSVHHVLAANTALNTTSTNTPLFRIDEKVGKARLSSAPLRRVLEENGFNKETKTRVPEVIWQGTRETVAEYLRGLYQADANIQSGGDVTTIALASKDYAFIKELQIVWANFGVKTSINKMRGRERKLMPDGKGGSKYYVSQPLYRLLITSIQGCRIAEDVIKLGNARSSRATIAYTHNLSKKGYDQKLYATFAGLVQLPNEDAYCLTVHSDTHAWTVNGLITKNTEITLNTSPEETAVCNLGSVNLVKHLSEGALDHRLLEATVSTAMRMLDNVIDLNFYPTPEAKHSNMKHRPVGLGIMGFQDTLYALDINFDSEACVEFADASMEAVSYYAIRGSILLARERGSYPTYKGSKWDRDILPLDTLDILERERGEAIDVLRTSRMDWEALRTLMGQYGMRNSNTLAIAPTATISNIAGTSPSIEPIYKNLYVKANMSGDFTVINPALIDDLKKLNLWDYEMLGKIKYHDGSVSAISEIPEHIRAKYKEAFEIHPRWLIKAAAYRGKWIDQSQSLNLFFVGYSGKDVSEMYLYAWSMGLKTTYYLRTLAASQVEKSTLSPTEFGETHTRKTTQERESIAPAIASIPIEIGVEAQAAIGVRMTGEADTGIAPHDLPHGIPLTIPIPPQSTVPPFSSASRIIESPKPEIGFRATMESPENGTPLKLCRIDDPDCEACQ